MNRRAVIVLVGGLTALFALLWLLEYGPFDSDERGIRVKNGSVTIMSESGKGFKKSGNGYKSKAKTKGCYDVIVIGGTCSGGQSLKSAKRLTFYRDNVPQETEDDRDLWILWHRFRLKDGTNWTASGAELTYGAPDAFLSRIVANNDDGASIDCRNGDMGAVFYADLKPVECK